MQIHNDISTLPVFRNAVITIGTFDGVHMGHMAIIKQMQAEAKIVAGETIIISFHPHPRQVIKTENVELSLLSTLDEKKQRLALLGIDHLVIIPFTETFAALSAESYIEDFLVHYFKPSRIIIGYDHRFGKGRTGNYALLERKEIEFGFRVVEIPAHVQNSIAISSTKIRSLLLGSAIENANAFLGYPYTISGKVIEGDKKGRTIGFPTANIQILEKEKLIPADGVYAVKIAVQGNIFNGMMNIGYRPTVSGTNRTIEVHIFNFSEEIYGYSIQIMLYNFIREEKKFVSLEALKIQLASDKEVSNSILNNY